MKGHNKNLNSAKKAKNDEFYTQLTDIEKELQHYKEHFKDKIVYCNCDDYRWSNFFQYFFLNFENLVLKKLIATNYSDDDTSYKIEVFKKKKIETKLTKLVGNGDFRSQESLDILADCDIVVTNPPFSLFREFIDLMTEYNKQFLIIGNMNAITYKNCFKLIKENKMWFGVNNKNMDFILPDGSLKNINCNWFTNIEHSQVNEELILHSQYNEKEYPKYDYYDAINIDKTRDIPMDYNGVMGVPISFLYKYNPNQFILLGLMNTGEINEGIRYENTPHGSPSINGKKKYVRILIKRK